MINGGLNKAKKGPMVANVSNSELISVMKVKCDQLIVDDTQQGINVGKSYSIRVVNGKWDQ